MSDPALTSPELGPHQRAAISKRRRTETFILDATKELFTELEKGNRETVPTVQEIAINAGIGLSTLFQAVGRRPEIISKVVARDITQAVDEAVSEQQETTEQIRAVAVTCFDYFYTRPHLANEYLQSIIQEPETDFISTRVANLIAARDITNSVVYPQSKAVTYTVLVAAQSAPEDVDSDSYRQATLDIIQGFVSSPET